MTSGGEIISTVEFENVIFQHPVVLEFELVPIRDDKRGALRKAFVVPKEGRQPKAEGIIEFCKQKPVRSKAPNVVGFCDLPITAKGKTRKFKLSEKSGRAAIARRTDPSV